MEWRVCRRVGCKGLYMPMSEPLEPACATRCCIAYDALVLPPVRRHFIAACVHHMAKEEASTHLVCRHQLVHFVESAVLLEIVMAAGVEVVCINLAPVRSCSRHRERTDAGHHIPDAVVSSEGGDEPRVLAFEP